MKLKINILCLSIIFILSELLASGCSPCKYSPQNKLVEPFNNLVMLTSKDTAYMRSHIDLYKSILQKGEKNLHYQATPCADLSPEPHYNAHGVNKNHKGEQFVAKDFRMSYTLALCYLLTGKKEYAIAAHNIMNAWAKTLKTIGTEQGKDEINFNAGYILMAACWTKNCDNWNHSEFDNMVRNIFLPNTLSSTNKNHGLWATLMEACAANYLNDVQLLNRSEKRWTEILEGEVKEDGTMPMEMERSATSNWRGGPDKGIKGIAYTHYTLLPASVAALIYAKYYGASHWKSMGGTLLEKAFHKAASWCKDPKTFPFYASNNGKLIDVEHYEYFTILAKYYPDSNASALLEIVPKGDQFYLYEIFKR